MWVKQRKSPTNFEIFKHWLLFLDIWYILIKDDKKKSKLLKPNKWKQYNIIRVCLKKTNINAYGIVALHFKVQEK